MHVYIKDLLIVPILITLIFLFQISSVMCRKTAKASNLKMDQDGLIALKVERKSSLVAVQIVQHNLKLKSGTREKLLVVESRHPLASRHGSGMNVKDLVVMIRLLYLNLNFSTP